MFDWIKKHSKWATYFLLGTTLIAVYKTFDSLAVLWSALLGIFTAIKPFVIAFVIAYMLNIPTKRLNNVFAEKVKLSFVNKHSNGLSVLVVYIVAITVVAWLVGTIVPAMIGDFAEMYNNIPLYAKEIAEFAERSDFAQRIGFQPETLDLQTELSNLATGLLSSGVMKDGIKTITVGMWSFASGFMNIFIAVIASIYMLLDKERILTSINNFANKFNNKGKSDSFISHWSNVNEIFTQYIYAKLISCAIIAVVCSIILILMDEKYAILLGIFIGFMELIPYFGSIISCSIGFIIMLISGGLSHALWCSVMMLVMQQIDGNIIAPKLTGDRLEIRPLAIIIAVSVGGSLFGFVGMLISVPIVAILKVIIVEFLDNRVERIKSDEQ